MTTWRLSVDGHEWLVRDRSGAPGAYDFDWLTGPDGYGFSMGSSNGTAFDEAAMRTAIAGFLAEVDPETGYLD
ncbi:hypothetical protein [Cellulomonas fimi]|uniref:hypothetical protein n=1 Tax=Cellulomonas fimi TaxID=1708 RepID=UPI00235877FF|nr:hypothetical protein [Cellulomonas fimi]